MEREIRRAIESRMELELACLLPVPVQSELVASGSSGFSSVSPLPVVERVVSCGC